MYWKRPNNTFSGF